MNDINKSKICGCYKEIHNYDCEHITKEDLQKLYKKAMDDLNKCRGLLSKDNKRSIFWEGKFKILKEENNALRKKNKQLIQQNQILYLKEIINI
ncbi:MAG: hypothetical protein RBR32_03705 [Bacteroidales bacterium]|nr:hypothetical protein [Bacteroidales bacterium]